jgi:predicted kinase
VLIDATFRQEKQRRLFLDAALRWGVPVLGLECQARPETVRRRLAERRGDVSDAGWAEHLQIAAQWEGPGQATQRYWRIVSTDGTLDEAAQQAMQALREMGLA